MHPKHIAKGDEPSFSSVTRYSLYALLIFTPLARASVQGWAVTTIHLLTLIALTAFLVEKSYTWSWVWIKTPLDKPILILIILSALSTFFSTHIYTSIWSIALLINYVTLYYLIIHMVRTRSQLRHFVYFMIGVSAFLSVFGFIKWIGANPFPWWDYIDRKPFGRLTSTFRNPNHLAGYMEMVLPLALGLILTGIRAGRRILIICVTMMLLGSLILSLSRGGWLGALIALVFMTTALLTGRHFTNKKLVAGIVGIVLAAAFIAFSTTPVIERIVTLTHNEPEANMHSRLTVWRGVGRMINDHPLLGTGPGTFATVYTQYQPPGLANRRFYAHNDYLHFISELGLVLPFVMLWMVIVFYRKGLKKINNPSRLVRGIAIGALSGITRYFSSQHKRLQSSYTFKCFFFHSFSGIGCFTAAEGKFTQCQRALNSLLANLNFRLHDSLRTNTNGYHRKEDSCNRWSRTDWFPRRRRATQGRG